jgi:hypothetical protein
LAPRLVSYRDSQRWVVVAIFAVAGILGLAFM